ncbi:MAG TPA: ABC transporter permease, partial [Kofleriaceae bacterium]
MRRTAIVCAGVFVALALACVVGPVIAGRLGLDGTTIDPQLGATRPDLAHWFGTDTLGRDLLVRVLLGGRIAIGVALVTTAFAVAIGVGYGAVAAYAGGRIDAAMMRIVDALYGFPALVFVIVVMAVTGARSLVALFALIGAISWLTLARITRGQVLALRHGELAVAARALGAGPARILARHILPNALPSLIVLVALGIGGAILAETMVSFLGFGDPKAISWGQLLYFNYES